MIKAIWYFMIHPLFHKVGWIPPKRCATDHVAIELHQLSSRLMSTAHDHVARFPSAADIVLGRGGCSTKPIRPKDVIDIYIHLYTQYAYMHWHAHTWNIQ